MRWQRQHMHKMIHTEDKKPAIHFFLDSFNDFFFWFHLHCHIWCWASTTRCIAMKLDECIRLLSIYHVCRHNINNSIGEKQKNQCENVHIIHLKWRVTRHSVSKSESKNMLFLSWCWLNQIIEILIAVHLSDIYYSIIMDELMKYMSLSFPHW